MTTSPQPGILPRTRTGVSPTAPNWQTIKRANTSALNSSEAAWAIPHRYHRAPAGPNFAQQVFDVSGCGGETPAQTREEQDAQCIAILLDQEGSDTSRVSAEAYVAERHRRAAALEAELAERRLTNSSYPRWSGPV